MTGTDRRSVEAPGSVVVAWRSGVLGVAIEAGLQAMGWQTPDANGTASDDDRASPARVVVVADESGFLPTLPARGLGSPPAIAVGLRRSISSVVRAVEQGVVVVVDGDQPFAAQMSALHHLLLDSVPQPDRAVLLQQLRGRAAEAGRLAVLTSRERHVLALLALGLGASDIADSEHVSLTTVRSHIRAVLAKLDVRTQLAAVAMARRAAYPDRRSPDPGNFINSDDAIRS